MTGGAEGTGQTPRVVWHPTYEADIGAHVFPTAKYRLVKERIVEAGLVEEGEIARPEPAGWEALARIHTDAYLGKVREGTLTPQEELLLEVPFSTELREAMRLCVSGSTLAARSALERGVAVHLGGGFHHAFPDHGEGFCLFNDVAVALATLLAEGRIAGAAVIDLDVHHGNGTAAIFADDPRVFTFSVHQERNYPAVKPPSDLDLGLENGIRDDAYLERLRKRLPAVLGDDGGEGSRPDLAFYLAGADPFVEDQLGGLALTTRGLRERDRTVIDACRDREIPLAVTLAGGYARHLDDTVAIHAATVEEALAEG